MDRGSGHPAEHLSENETEADHVVGEFFTRWVFGRCAGGIPGGQTPEGPQRHLCFALAPGNPGLMGEHLLNGSVGFSFNAELGPIFRYRGIQLNFALLDQLVDADRSKCFGAGESEEGGLRGGRLAAVGAQGLIVDHLSILDHHHLGGGMLALLDLVLKQGVQGRGAVCDGGWFGEIEVIFHYLQISFLAPN